MAATERSAVYIKSVDGTDDILYDGRPHIAFIGRSNVGKSSLINSLLARKIARSSSNPGKTVLLDLFLINNDRYFVDLPGYGFANVSKRRQEHFRKLITWYLCVSGVRLQLVVLIVDAYVGITRYDQESIDLLTEHDIPFVIAANKIDKLKRGQRAQRLRDIEAVCGGIQVIPYSAVTGEGRGELLRIIFSE